MSTKRCIFLTAFALLFLNADGIAATPNDSGVDALTKLGALAGDWTGMLEWSGARTGTGTLKASYYVTGNGSAVVENLIMGGVPMMTSVYHADGEDLRMTHYCAAKNQPRLKATRIDTAKGIYDFAFVDATNMMSSDAGHVHRVELRLKDANHIVLTFVFEAAGAQSRERIELNRVAAKNQ
jgi:hypothetical protein